MAKRKKKSVVNATSEHRKNIAKNIIALGRVNSSWIAFNDFLAVSAISISNNSDPYHIATSEKLQAEREKRYLDIIGNYNERERNLIAETFAELVLELQSYCDDDKAVHLTDVLGEMFHELEFQDEWKAQFFTPQCVSDVMGGLAIDDEEVRKKALAEKGYFTVNEPCCGGGAIIYGMANAMNKIGLNRSKDVLVFAGDIDERCVFMTYIQCSLYGIPAIVQQKNALSDEVLSPPWFTPAFVWNSWRWRDLWKEQANNEAQNKVSR